MGERGLPRLRGERRVSFYDRDGGFRRDPRGLGGFLAERSPVPMKTRIMVEAVLKDPSHFVGVQASSQISQMGCMGEMPRSFMGFFL